MQNSSYRPEDEDITLSAEQSAALDEICAWFTNEKSKQIEISGPAGAGKTILIRRIRKALQNTARIAVGAFTGKAVSVLRLSGIYDAMTLHSLLYEQHTDSEGKTIWVLRTNLPFNLIIVDEGSMISQSLKNDLDKIKARVIYVGDDAQLEPVGGDPRIMRHARIKLKHIHRQAEGNPIITLSRDIREGNTRLQLGTWESPTGKVRVVDTLEPEDILASDMIVCGYNSTRHRINAQKRRLLGLSGHPQAGEEIMALQNNSRENRYNGMSMTIDRIISMDDDSIYADLSSDFEGMQPSVMIDKRFFTQDYDAGKNRFDPFGAPFTYGYCLTGHKSQGSSAQNVLVVEEILKGEHARWLYTVVTRARVSVTIVRSSKRISRDGYLPVAA